MRRTLICIAGAAALATALSACGSNGGDATAGCSTVASSLTVTAQDKLQFDAKAYEATAGCIDITYENAGSVDHTLLVKGQSGFKLTVGDRDTGQLTLPAGTYTLYCDVSGHQAAGMEATLTVS